MRRNLIKKALSLLTVLALVLSVTITASAAVQPPATIRLDGSDLAVTTVQKGRGRLYAPATEMFQAFGATSTVDVDKGTLTAVKGSLTVEFAPNAYSMTVTEGKHAQTVFIDAVPYKDKSGAIYVPVRYTAQAFGYVVDWDGAANAVILKSVDSLIAEGGATYAVMDRYLAAQKAFYEKAHALNGTFKLNLTLSVSSDSDKKTAPLNASGTIAGVVKKGDSDLQLKMTSNATEFAASLNSGDVIDGQTKFILALLDSLSLRLITNSQTGMLYLQSPLSATIAGAKSDIWVSVSQEEQTSGNILSSLGTQMLTASSFRDYLSSSLKTACLNDRGAGSSSVSEELLVINSMLSDKSFVKDGDNYVSTYNSGMGGGSVQIKANLKLTFKFAGTSYNGMTLDAALDMGESGSIALLSDTDRSNSGSIQVNINLPTTLTASLTSNLTYSDTASVPATEPPAGSTVLPMEGLFSSMLPNLH